MAQGFYSSRKRRRDNCEMDSYDLPPLPKKLHNMSFNEHANEGLATQPIEYNHLEQGGYVGQHSCVQNLGSVRHSPSQFPEYLPAANRGINNSFEATPSGTNSDSVGNNWNTQSPPNQQHSWMSAQIVSHYIPDLSAADNPHYYENNKILFALHMERMQRGGPQFY